MRAVRGRNTRPEIAVRRLLHRMGLRFRLHDNSMPGRPDIVLPRWRTVVFVHGCFWHRHAGCGKATNPEANRAFWMDKFNQNRARDRRNRRQLRRLGWNVIVVWECETGRLDRLEARLKRVLGTDS